MNANMKKKRTIMTIKQFDYATMADFVADISRMRKKGYTLIDGNLAFDKSFQPHEVNDDVWTYSACFYKSTLA